MKRFYIMFWINLSVGILYYIASVVHYFLLSEVDRVYKYNLYNTPAALTIPINSIVTSLLIIFIYLLVNRLCNKITNTEHFKLLGIGMGITLLANIILWWVAGFILPLIKPEFFVH